MRINFENVPEERQEELRRAAAFFAGALMPQSVVSELEIDLVFDLKTLNDGMCGNEDDDINDPRYFTISINPALGNPISTLAHELVHVKQYAMNEFRTKLIFADEEVKFQFRWKRKIWNAQNGEDPYFDSPWEIEAFGREVGLMARYNALMMNQEPKPHYKNLSYDEILQQVKDFVKNMPEE